MLSLAVAAFACAAVAFGSQGAALLTLASAALAWIVASTAFGVIGGAVTTLTALATAASVLVLLVPQRPTRARGLALGSGVVGVLSAAFALASGPVP